MRQSGILYLYAQFITRRSNIQLKSLVWNVPDKRFSRRNYLILNFSQKRIKIEAASAFVTFFVGDRVNELVPVTSPSLLAHRMASSAYPLTSTESEYLEMSALSVVRMPLYCACKNTRRRCWYNHYLPCWHSGPKSLSNRS